MITMTKWIEIMKEFTIIFAAIVAGDLTVMKIHAGNTDEKSPKN